MQMSAEHDLHIYLIKRVSVNQVPREKGSATAFRFYCLAFCIPLFLTLKTFLTSSKLVFILMAS